ncbi:Glyoxylate/succinic semialdehyde reductase 2, chloroplastic [Zea mays]|uniref:Glyoxylate/succinic semialdehyde reductase 2, chloroplastic n=1 Tax=Zea mays TaxID=4577 RepID=A0A3L6FCI7_MAIZE|nr:Glyoxylate/succinic semialdehyde reductase 2, chloroplastic [Zea mays]
MPAAAFFSAGAAPALPPPSRTLSRRLVVSRAAAAAASASASSSSGWQGGGGVEFQGKVGFLGLGIMGAPMASNLIKAGCDVTVWNRTKSKCDPLLSLGAKYATLFVFNFVFTYPICDPFYYSMHSSGTPYEPTPAQVASSCDVTFAMLADPQSAAEVACGSSGAAEGLAPGKGYVDVSTVDGATSKLIGERITSTGASFLEAPVSGSKKPAEDGLLIFLTAGDESLYKRVEPLLDVMGKVNLLSAKYRNGAAMKLVVNMVMGSMMVSFSEGLLLSEKVGLDPNTLVEVISQGAISAPMFSLKGPSMVKAAYPPAFPLKHQQKDLRLALALAESVSQSIPTVAAANELYKAAKSLGLSDHDFSAVIEALKAKVQSQSSQ